MRSSVDTSNGFAPYKLIIEVQSADDEADLLSVFGHNHTVAKAVFPNEKVRRARLGEVLGRLHDTLVVAVK